MTPIEAGETILRAIDYILKTYPENIDKIKELEAQQCDLLHAIEFETLTYPKGYKLAKDLKEIRLERRRYKDENEVLKHLHDYLANGTSQNFVLGLTSNLAKAKRRNEQLQERTYTPRSQAFEESGGEGEC